MNSRLIGFICNLLVEKSSRNIKKHYRTVEILMKELIFFVAAWIVWKK